MALCAESVPKTFFSESGGKAKFWQKVDFTDEVFSLFQCKALHSISILILG